MPEARTQLSISRRTRAWTRGGVAAPLALIALTAWGGRATALDLTASLSPPPVPHIQKTLEKAVDDARRGLGNAMDSVKRKLEAVGGGNRGVPQGEPEPLGVATQSRARAGRTHEHKSTAQKRSGSGGDGDDIDELVASGDEIGSARANGHLERGQVDRPAEPLPFSGFDPLRLSLVGLGLILAGLALVDPARNSGSAPAA